MNLIFLISIVTKNLNSTSKSILPKLIGRLIKPGTAGVVAQQSIKIPLSPSCHNPGKKIKTPCINLIILNKFEMILIPNQRLLPLGLSKRTIDYTWTLTIFPNTIMVLVFFIGNKISPQFHLHPTDLSQCIFSISNTDTYTNLTVTPCSIAVCKSIGNVQTANRICCVLFDSGSSKTLIHKQIVPRNYTPISSHNDLQVFLLAGATTPMALVAHEKI